MIGLSLGMNDIDEDCMTCHKRADTFFDLCDVLKLSLGLNEELLEEAKFLRTKVNIHEK